MSDIQDQGSDQDQGVDPAIEREARRQGWRPQEEFRGPEEQWVDAPTYVQRGKEIRAHVKAENERLTRELAAANVKLTEQGATIEEIKAYHAQMEERAITTAIDRLKKEKRAAIAAGDAGLASDIDDDIEELKTAPRMKDKLGKTGEGEGKSKPDEQGQGKTPELHPVVKQWQADNASWYNDEPENEDLVAYANGIAGRLGPRTDLSMEEKAEELTSRVKKMFPDRFGTPRAKAGVTPGAGEGGGARSRKNNTVGSLPDDAKQAGARFVKQGLYKDMEAYAAEYWKQMEPRR